MVSAQNPAVSQAAPLSWPWISSAWMMPTAIRPIAATARIAASADSLLRILAVVAAWLVGCLVRTCVIAIPPCDANSAEPDRTWGDPRC